MIVARPGGLKRPGFPDGLFKSLHPACRTIAGHWIMVMVRKGQVTPARDSLPRKRFLN